DRAVLMRDPAVVAGRDHAVMGTKRLVTLRQVGRGLAVEIVEGRGEAVAAMLQRRPAQCPERILESLGEGDEALAAQHHFGMLPAGEGEPELIEPVCQRLAGNGDLERTRIGE